MSYHPATMHLMYESRSFVVVGWTQTEQDAVLAFELVDKPAGEQVFLVRDAAQAFRAQCKAWEERTPDKAEVDATVRAYMQLGRLPLVTH